MIPEETRLRSSPNVSESEPIEVPPHPRPKTLNKTQRYEGTRWVAGEGPRDARVMFVATSVLQEEEIDHNRASYGIKLFDPPRYLKGPAGQILSNLADQTGLSMDSCYYTSICKWLLPKPKRTNPSKTSIDAGLPLLLEEISQVNPDIIVCLGKPVFDNLYGQKFKLNDIAGGWFTQVIAGRLRRLYPMEDVTKLVTKPEYVPRFTMDLKEVSRMLRRIDGVYVGAYEEKYEVIHNSQELQVLVDKLRAGQYKILSVDCEWHGENHMVGQLRSLQICWAPGEAAYIRFMDDQLNYVFDVSYREAGEILSPWLDREDVKYVGHHISADLPWMHAHLGLEWFDKAWFDTEFGQQCVEESSELGLERLGMAYSDLGRYDVELTRWCKKNSSKVKDGYGLVPDHILIPYSVKDVDIVMRSYPHIIRQLEQDYGGRAYEYYRNIFNPFVTNVFTSFTLYGLPVNRQRVDHLRDLYQWARREMLEEFRVLMVDESEKLLLRKLMSFKDTPETRRDVVRGFKEVKALADSGDIQGAKRLTFELAGPENAHLIGVVWDHFERAPEFNANSADHVRPWLFEVKGYTPVKSTTNKAKGIPSVPWETVMGYDPDKRREFNPSADKQTVEILAQTHEDPTLLQLMAYKSVDTVCKSFLGEPDEDEDGNVIQEKGIHAYITPNDTLVSNTSCTETGRPRSWKPNLLNLPSWVNKKIENGLHQILVLRESQGKMPEEYRYLLDNPKALPSVRSIVTAPPGWCIVESDYATAELRAWAYISGDQQMIDLLTKPDPCFAKVKPEKFPLIKGKPDEDCVCRLTFPEYIDTQEFQEYMMTYTVDTEVLARFTEDDLVKDEAGNIVHTKQDLHWSLAEMMQKRPREVLSKKAERGAAKTGNFSTAYGASGNTLERKIESDTGVKPLPGTGDKLLETLMKRQPRAFEFMEEMEKSVEDPGYIVAASGRVRHFHLHSRSTVGNWNYKGVVSALGREGRNYQMQESVAATAARASSWMWQFKRLFDLQGRPIAVLYDSVVTLCPSEEREIWKLAHDLFMYEANGWQYEDRILTYPVDHELNQSWSMKPTEKELEAILAVPVGTKDNQVLARKWLEEKLAFVRKFPKMSTKGAAWMLKATKSARVETPAQ